MHCAAMQSFIWKQLCQAVVLFLEAAVCTVGHAGLRLDMEYHAVNHRELRGNRQAGFQVEPDRPNSILIAVSTDKQKPRMTEK